MVGTTPATCAGGPAQLAGADAPQDMCVAAQAISHRIALSRGRVSNVKLFNLREKDTRTQDSDNDSLDLKYW